MFVVDKCCKLIKEENNAKNLVKLIFFVILEKNDVPQVYSEISFKNNYDTRMKIGCKLEELGQLRRT